MENREAQYLKTVVDDFWILMDVSAVMCPHFDSFMENITPELKEQNKFVCMTGFELGELKLMSAENSERGAAAKSVFEKLKKLNSERLFSILTKFDSYEALFADLDKRSRICFVTQKCKNVEKITSIEATKDFAQFVTRQQINGGFLGIINARPQGGEHKMTAKPKRRPDLPQKDEAVDFNVDEQNKFQVKQSVVQLKNKPLKIHVLPKASDSVFDEDKRSYRLVQAVETLSDSVVYKTDSGMYAKIYKAEALDTYHFEKCKLMVSKQVTYAGICWPQKLLYNSKGEFAGYLAGSYEGQPLQLSVFKKAGLDTHFANWQKQDLVQLAITILQKIIILNKHNVLIGCPDPASIMVKDPQTVYFTNTDKYQVEDYPCLLRNILFIAPELLGDIGKMFLFDSKTENYATAVMLFMLMMPGKPPYAHRGRKNIKTSISEMQFPYAFGENHSKGVPPGFWRFVWSHLYYDLKRMFYQTFQKDEALNAPDKRLSAEKWLWVLKRFYGELSSGEYCKNDKYSALMFPETFRKAKGVEYKPCSCCGREFPVWFMDEFDICRSCQHKMSSSYFDCVDCGRRFYYTIREERLHMQRDWHKQKHCEECKRPTVCAVCGQTYPAYQLRGGRCRECNNRPVMTAVCKVCGRTFDITYGEKLFYEKRGMNYPRTCKSCKQNRR
ncbi:MAG: zinc-ribbon domain containing protein [Clostridia bacterium]|nr:zinc-ribbon domain containing protein [Clostridia bacterium]